MNETLFITGGTRSGKTAHARSRVEAALESRVNEETRVLWASLADSRTGKGFDSLDWTDLSTCVDPAAWLEEAGPNSIRVLDSITDWARCRLEQGDTPESILDKAHRFAETASGLPGLTLVVSNEIGGGVVPIEVEERRFRDVVGSANQILASAFSQVIHMVAGLPQEIKCVRGQDSDTIPQSFNAADKAAVYDAIYLRRDIRHFRPDPVPEPLLYRILDAAHHAGSVGFMQPWNFIVIRDPAIKAEVAGNFRRANTQAREHYEGERQELYDSLKLAGIEESPVNICVTCDPTRGGEHVLGRDTIPETDLYSTCCAVQNLWLAARAEGLGVGWVSILSVPDLKRTLNIPEHVLPVAYLCVGYPREFYEAPMLELAGWADRLPLDQVVHFDRFPSRNGSSQDGNGK